MIATVRAGNPEATEDLIRVIRSGVDLSQLAAHVRNECRANMAIQQSFDNINFVIDGPDELPSPKQLLSSAPLRDARSHRASISEASAASEEVPALRSDHSTLSSESSTGS